MIVDCWLLVGVGVVVGGFLFLLCLFDCDVLKVLLLFCCVFFFCCVIESVFFCSGVL